jgi:hypothetical protein
VWPDVEGEIIAPCGDTNESCFVQWLVLFAHAVRYAVWEMPLSENMLRVCRYGRKVWHERQKAFGFPLALWKNNNLYNLLILQSTSLDIIKSRVFLRG